MKKQFIILYIILLVITSLLKAQDRNQLWVKESPQGIYLFLSRQAAGTHLEGSTLARIDITRALPGEKNFVEIARVSMPGSPEAFKKTAGDSSLIYLAYNKKLKNETEAWQYLLKHPASDDYGLLALEPKFMTAMGFWYIDKQALAVVKSGTIRYKVNYIQKDGINVLMTLSGEMQPGRPPEIGKPRMLTKSESDKSISITWTGELSKSSEAFTADVYRSDDFGKGFRKAGRIFANKDSASNTLQYFWSEEVTPSRFYRYFIIPLTVSGLAGPASDTIQLVAVSTSSIQAITYMSATDTLQGVLLRWTPSPKNTLVSGLALERSRGAAEGYLVIDTIAATDSLYIDRRVIPGLNYFYRLRTVTIRNESLPPSAFASITVKGKGSFLQPPAGIKVTAGKNNIRLSWSPSVQPQVSGYTIYRSNGITDSLQMLIPFQKDTSFTDSLLLFPGYQYKYGMKVIDTENRTSGFSDLVFAGVLEKKMVNAPEGVTTAAEPGRVSLIWNNPETHVTGFNVYRYTGVTTTGNPDKNYSVNEILKQGFQKINNQQVTVAGYRDGDAGTGQRQFYAITAVDAFGNESETSLIAVSDVPEIVWGAPGEFGLENTSKGISVSWDNISINGITDIIISRRASTDNQSQKIATVPVKDKIYLDTTALKGIIYYYAIAYGSGVKRSVVSLEKGILR